MKRALFPILALIALAALAFYLPKVVQQTEGFAPLAESMTQDIATQQPPVPESAPVSPTPQQPDLADAPTASAMPAPVFEPSPAAPELTPFIEAMAAGDHAKAAAYLDLIKSSLPADQVQSLTSSVSAARKREEEAAKAALEAKAAQLAAEKALQAKMTAQTAPTSSATDAAVVESLRQLQQAQQQTTRMLAEINEKQQMQPAAAPSASPQAPSSGESMTDSTTIKFARDSSLLSDADRTSLTTIITTLQKDESSRVELRGFADRSGDSSYNLSLSRARATAVQDVFRRAGIPAGRITLLPMGSFQSAADLTPEQAAAMRKVEVVVVK